MPVNERGYCRLCCRQAHLVRPAHESIDVAVANARGQQLFFADMARNTEPAVDRALGHVRTCTWPQLPVAHEQLVFFEVVPDLAVRLRHLSEPPVPGLIPALDAAVAAHAGRHGWSDALQSATRRSIHMLVSVQHTPGRRIKDSEVERLRSLQLYTMTVVREVLVSVDMFEDDAEAPLEQWFRVQMANVHPQIADEVTEWFHAIRDGRAAAPRTRKRDLATVRRNVADVRTALRSWTSNGYTSLREVERGDVIAALPAEPSQQNQTATALRSLFRFLKANRSVFLNPTTRVRAVRVQPNYPLSVDADVIRGTLNSSNPVRSAMAATVVFHGLSTSELAAVMLSDVQDGRLAINGRSVVLAEPVRERIASWLNERNRRWPATINPHLFINKHTALRTTPVSGEWISQTARVPVKKLREDRILGEAVASDGDARLLGDLFGLSTGGAQRYTLAVEQDARFGS